MNLEDHVLLLGLSQSSKRYLITLGREQVASKDQTICSQGSYNDSLVIIKKGGVGVKLYPGGDRTKEGLYLVRLKEGSVVGYGGFLSHKQPRCADVIVLSDEATVFGWNGQTLRTCFDKNPDIGYHFLWNLAAYIARDLARQNEALTAALSQRVELRREGAGDPDFRAMFGADCPDHTAKLDRIRKDPQVCEIPILEVDMSD